MQFRDLQKQYEVLKEQIDAAMINVATSAHFISGPEVKELEKKLAEYAREALETLENFMEKHPDDTEIAWIRRSIEKVNSHIARRYCKLGDFYKKSGKNETAEHYYAMVLSDYPDTPEAREAEKKLAVLDKEFIPMKKPYEPKKRKFVETKFPEEPEVLLVQPDDSNGSFLLPVKDLKRNISAPQKITDIKEKVDDDAL